jgi:hypothetical protein
MDNKIELVEFIDGKMQLNFHPGQKKAWKCDKRFVSVLAGTQGGKTVLGPPWLLREISRRGPGDYMIVCPTYKLLDLKALPTFRKLFEKNLGLGEFVGYRNKFVFSDWGKRRLFGEDFDGAESFAFSRSTAISASRRLMDVSSTRSREALPCF